MPDIVSFAFDVKKFAKFTLPNASESDDVPANLRPDIAVESVIPFVIVAKPDIEAFGVKVSSEIIPIKFPSLYHLVIFCDASAESKIVSYVNPLIVPVPAGGPTKIFTVPFQK